MANQIGNRMNLLPCPFCGEESDDRDNGPQLLFAGNLALVECQTCRCQGTTQYGNDRATIERDAALSWNRRAKNANSLVTAD